MPWYVDFFEKIFPDSELVKAYNDLVDSGYNPTFSSSGGVLGGLSPSTPNSGSSDAFPDVSSPTSGTEVESKPITGSNAISDATSNLNTTFDGNFLDYLSGLFGSVGEIINSNQQYNAEQSLASRQWLEQMSNTQYQRAVADLKAAGLNPILALGNSFSGASVPNSAPTASSNNVSGDTFGSILATLGDIVGMILENLPTGGGIKKIIGFQ